MRNPHALILIPLLTKLIVRCFLGSGCPIWFLFGLVNAMLFPPFKKIKKIVYYHGCYGRFAMWATALMPATIWLWNLPADTAPG
jgi:hypothetical protein